MEAQATDNTNVQAIEVLSLITKLAHDKEILVSSRTWRLITLRDIYVTRC